MHMWQLLSLSVTFAVTTKCASDFYKKLQDGATIIPTKIKEETDSQNREAIVFCDIIAIKALALMVLINFNNSLQRNNVLHNPVHQRGGLHRDQGRGWSLPPLQGLHRRAGDRRVFQDVFWDLA